MQATAHLPHPHSHSAGAAHPIPSIRLISATPSTTGISSSDGGNSSTSTSSAAFARSLEDSWEAAAAASASTTSLALAPKVQEIATGGKKRLVPKKSKLGMGIFSSTPFTSSSLSSGSGSIKPPANADLSDVVRRVGVELPSSSNATSASASAASIKAKGGFEIYVDPTVDPDIGEILVVRKRPSRVRGGLGGVGWGMESDGVIEVPPVPSKGQPMGEKTNLGGGKGDEKEGGKERWWTIGRGRKDSKEEKEKEKEKKKGKENSKMSSSLKRRFFSFSFFSVSSLLTMMSFSFSCGIYTRISFITFRSVEE